MAHGGYGKKKMGRAALGRGGGGGAGRGRGFGKVSGGVRKENEKKKSKLVSTKNQIRSIERLLKKELPPAVKEAQLKRLEELKLQSNAHATAELERKMALRYRRVKFFERRKIERRIRRFEKQQRALLDNPSEDNETQLTTLADQLHQLKEDLEYIRFFPKTEKYISLYMGMDDPDVKAKRNELRERIKANLLAAAAAGHELEETGSEDDVGDMSEDDFFMAGSSSDDADADDEWTDKSPRAREEKDDTLKALALSAPQLPLAPLPAIAESVSHKMPDRAFKPNKQAVKDQKQKFAKTLMPPPPMYSKFSSSKSTYNADKNNKYNRPSSSSGAGNSTYNAGKKKQNIQPPALSEKALSETASKIYHMGMKKKNPRTPALPATAKKARHQTNSSATDDHGNARAGPSRSGPSSSTTSYEMAKSSVSDGPVEPHKPKRKRRPKKK
ncbi:uncharacterized protein [Physcomitrium patens]|uniref:rRNA-processing protein EFG1 n=1 Tax=Physcomitrium patens TaxID=3218 RepID=A0A2K1L4L2_PHYPA|nr:uncharacterized protein LOC112293559 isoform X2 [Physcomitrium patens]PNR60963.1 hypothetical protein PHYPA_003756 [Physcomitrium patens]|eukprot:XP_024398929.1 uncharacterized protein LOC112293559 isoform X2 [Physcomitrella patens]